MEKNKKVLVIDDDAHIRRIIQIKLKKKGYSVLTAKNGEEGLNMIKAEKPDAVISDINMPKIDGMTLCKMTNELKKERPYLTIIVTARISPDERDWVKEMTDTQFMEKPFSPSKLIEAIDQYFGIS
ncbi:MAG: response regulator [Desulfobacterales bacterium]